MAVWRPAANISPSKPSGAMPTLMANQDTAGKGDADDGDEKVLVTFWVTRRKRETMRAFAREHEMSVSRMIVEGVNWRMRQG